MTSSLTKMQKAYIWLAGSYPDRVLVQGRGRRSHRLLYALNRPEEVVVFGYSNPPIWLLQRGLLRRLQARNTYTLTEDGEHIFRKLLATGAGLKINAYVRETRVKEVTL